MTFRLDKSVKMFIDSGIATEFASNRPVTMEQFVEQWQQVKSDLSLENNYSVLEAYQGIYTKSTAQIRKIIDDVNKVKSFYLVDVLIYQVIEDALTPEVGTNQIFTIKYPKDETIERELQRLERKLSLDQLVLDICYDLLCYGSYTLQTEIDTVKERPDELNDKKMKRTKSKGLVALKDNVEPASVIKLAKDSTHTGYLVFDQDKGKIKVCGISDYVQFTYGTSRVRVKLEDQFSMFKTNENLKKFLADLPRYVKIGRSLVYPFISKIRELELLEKLIPASKLSKLSNVNLVGMTLPGQFDVEKGQAAAQRFENLINNKVGVDNRLGELTVESILSIAGRTKIIPLFGEKGNLQKLDFKQDEADDLTATANDIRQLITDSMGVPYELIYKSEGANKSEILKKNARYLRKLKNLQRCLSEGIKEVCCIHLANMDVKFNEDDIQIEFFNKLIEIDNLDKLEHADITISFIKNMVDFFAGQAEEGSPFRKLINLNAVAEYVNRQLKTIGLDDVYRVSSEGGETISLEQDSEFDTSDIDAGETNVGIDDEQELGDTDTEDEIVQDTDLDTDTENTNQLDIE